MSGGWNRMQHPEGHLTRKTAFMIVPSRPTAPICRGFRHGYKTCPENTLDIWSRSYAHSHKPLIGVGLPLRILEPSGGPGQFEISLIAGRNMNAAGTQRFGCGGRSSRSCEHAACLRPLWQSQPPECDSCGLPSSSSAVHTEAAEKRLRGRWRPDVGQGRWHSSVGA